ncbi:MAG: radical SAM protein [Candidatus Methanomethylicia archaeon]
MFKIAFKDSKKCMDCGACDLIVSCSAGKVGNNMDCIGCGACSLTCPYEAITMIDSERINYVPIIVNSEKFNVPERITVLKALELIGFRISKFPGEGDIFAPCGVGGCWSCAVIINGELKPSCITPIKNGMKIETKVPENYTIKRAVHGWMGHSVGGVGTPWWLKGKGYIEAAVFACGCNLRCPQCQNWTTTYCGNETPLTPREAAIIMTDTRRIYGVDRMAISGGESTLNRSWLIQYIKELKRLNRDERARFHVDTNTTILTSDYIDELVEVGMTDIGPDLKGLKIETFMNITGLNDRNLAEKYLKTSWDAFKYIINKYYGKIFIGVGIPYNKDLISMEEMVKIGDEIYKICPEIQVCVLDYRPEFRRRNIARPKFREMVKVWEALRACGLKTVICQTERGHIGPK